MKIYSLKTKYLFGNASRFWLIFILAGIFAWLSPYLFEQENEPVKVILVGAFGVLAGLTLRFSYSGIQIDKKNHRIREFSSFFGIRKGDWTTLPSFSKVVHTKNKVSFWNTPNGVSPTFKSSVTTYTIGLFAGAENPEYIIQSESEALSKNEAKRISELLNVTLEEQ